MIEYWKSKDCITPFSYFHFRVYEKPKKESIFAQNVHFSMQNFAHFFSQNVQAL